MVLFTDEMDLLIASPAWSSLSTVFTIGTRSSPVSSADNSKRSLLICTIRWLTYINRIFCSVVMIMGFNF